MSDVPDLKPEDLDMIIKALDGPEIDAANS
jgi:hypothetical protein